jgi:S-adenosylmethionine-diacylgycerolhomoserine-N-methlytransferase
MSDAAALMDRMYRRQRHIYDLSRKFYLLGRDEAITRLRPAPGDRVLEIGCGTGRNLVKLAQAYPEARLFGVDVSQEMLATAAASTTRAGSPHASPCSKRTQRRSTRGGCSASQVSSA